MKRIVLSLIVISMAFVLTSCAKKEEYKVGDIGPAGGYVFYDKGTYSNGWRYLEAAPADLSVVNGIPTVDKYSEGYNSGKKDFKFGYYLSSSANLDKPSNDDVLYVNGKQYFDWEKCTDTAIGSGKKNTQLLVKAMGNKAAYLGNSGIFVTTNEYAAKLCDDLKHQNGSKTYSDWFLPSKDELDLMYQNLRLKRLGEFTIGSALYWSSSENEAYSVNAWEQSFDTGKQLDWSRGSSNRVRPIRAF